jgi:hypothetical protein
MEKRLRAKRGELRVAVKLTAFALVAVVCLAVGAGVGTLVGPIHVGANHGGH